MDFGEALDLLHNNTRVARPNWHHQGMWLVLVPGSTITVEADRPLGLAAPEMVGEQVRYLPHIDLVTADGEMMPWTPTQADLLAEDWYVVR
jgi:Protein of unknown function (DUF2829)